MGFRTGRKYAITWCKKAVERSGEINTLECYDEAIKRDPTFAKPWYEKGKIFVSAPDLPKNYYWVHTISPYITGTPAPEYPDIGHPVSKYIETLKMFNKATELDPKFVDAWFAKGDFHLDYVNGEDDAIECFDKIIALDPKFDPAWHRKAYALLQLGRYEESIQCCDKAIALLPADAKGGQDNSGYSFSSRWRVKADALAKLDKDKEAIKCYDKSLEISWEHDNDIPFMLAKKGIALAKLGRYKEAIKCYDEALPGLQKWGMPEKFLAKINLEKANAISELGSSDTNEYPIKYYSHAIRFYTDRLFDSKRNPVEEDRWKTGVKKLQETCSQAINGLKKYYDYQD